MFLYLLGLSIVVTNNSLKRYPNKTRYVCILFDIDARIYKRTFGKNEEEALEVKGRRSCFHLGSLSSEESGQRFEDRPGCLQMIHEDWTYPIVLRRLNAI